MVKPLLERSHHWSHSDAERALTGTWCTPEIEDAINQGDDVLKVHEIWHFPQTSSNLFTSYINTFLKLKQEADGGPSNVGEHEERRQQYLQDCAAHKGIQLSHSAIEKNPAMRALAKLMLNSFWGKFGQQSNKCQVQAINSPAKFYELLNDDEVYIHAMRVVNEETTCHARLYLYRQALYQLVPEQVLYMDTDSIIYKHSPGQPQLPTGDYLGPFKNEVDERGIIIEFATAGRKNYGYKTHKGKVKYRVRRFSLNAHKIVRDPQSKQIMTQTEIKRYQFVADKRLVNAEDFHSYPSGRQRQ